MSLPSRRQAMRPIVNVLEEDRATDNMHNRKDRACGSEDIVANGQTDRQIHRHTHHSSSQPIPRAK